MSEINLTALSELNLKARLQRNFDSFNILSYAEKIPEFLKVEFDSFFIKDKSLKDKLPNLIIVFANNIEEEKRYVSEIKKNNKVETVLSFYDLIIKIILAIDLKSPLKKTIKEKKIIVFSLPRSGSTLFSELLTNNKLGNCKEHIRDPLIQLKSYYDIQVSNFFEDLTAYSQSKTFSTKIISHFLFGLLKDEQELEDFANWIKKEKCLVIYLERKFKPAQAISEYFAQKTNIYHSFQKKDEQQDEKLEYNYDEIKKWFDFLVAQEKKLKDFINGISFVLHFNYHQVANERETTLINVFKNLRLPIPNKIIIETRIKKLKRSNSKELLSRFQTEINWK